MVNFKIAKKLLLLLLLFCVFLQFGIRAQNDTILVRRTIDSLLDLKQNIWTVLGNNPRLMLSKFAILKKYPLNSLSFQVCQIMADTYVRNGENELAKQYIDTCYEIASKLRVKKYVAKVKYTHGIYLKFNGKSDAAFKTWFEALALFKEIGAEREELAVLSAIAKEYNDLNQNEKAEKYLIEIIKRKTKLNDELGLSQSYNTIANVLTDTKRYSEAIVYFNKAIALSTKLADTVNLAYSFNNLARVYNKQNLLKEAENNWLKSYALFMRTENAYGTAMIINNMAYIAIKLKKFQEGITFAKRAVEYATEYGIKEELQRAHSNLIDAYYGLGDFKQGYKEYEIIMDMKDVQFNKDVANALAEAEQKYKSKIQRDSITILNTDKKVNALLYEEEKANTLHYKIGLVATILLVLMATALSFFILKNRKARDQLEQQKKLSTTIFETEQQERERIARDLHDSVGQKLSVVKMKLSMGHSHLLSTSELIDQAIADVRVASHNLMPEEINKGLSGALHEMVEQINYTQKITKINLKISDEFKRFTLTKQAELYLYRISQEIITNALKYAKAENIHISMEATKEQITLILSDDGIGFNSSLHKQDGIGLKNISARVEQLKGTVNLQSILNEGTRYSIQIPL